MTKINFLNVFCLIVTLLSNGIREGSAVINGDIANPADFKYLVTFWNSSIHLCGGAILDDWHVLTAAHCVVPVEKTLHSTGITLAAGTANFNVSSSSTFSTTVEKIYVSDKYNHSDWSDHLNGPLNDIAVLKVRDSFNLQDNPNLAAVQLPGNFTGSDVYANKTVEFAGYGYQDVQLSKINDTVLREIGSTTGELRKSPLFIIDYAKCIVDYRKYLQFGSDWLSAKNSTKEVEDFPEIITQPANISSEINSISDDNLIRDYQMCTRMTAHGLNSNEKQGLCSGDSGSPLVDGNTVIGVLSFNGFECNDRGLPNVFTIVSRFVDFVRNAMSDTVVEGMRVSPILPAERISVPKLTRTITTLL